MTFGELLGLLGSAGNRRNVLHSVGDWWELLLFEIVGDCWEVLGIFGKCRRLFGNSCEIFRTLLNCWEVLGAVLEVLGILGDH